MQVGQPRNGERGSAERKNELSQRKIRIQTTGDAERGFEDEGEVMGIGKYQDEGKKEGNNGRRLRWR